MKKEPRTYWAAFDEKGNIAELLDFQPHQSRPLLYLTKKGAEWNGCTKDVRKVKIVEVRS